MRGAAASADTPAICTRLVVNCSSVRQHGGSVNPPCAVWLFRWKPLLAGEAVCITMPCKGLGFLAWSPCSPQTRPGDPFCRQPVEEWQPIEWQPVEQREPVE